MEQVLEDIKIFGKDFPENFTIPRRKLGETGKDLSVIRILRVTSSTASKYGEVNEVCRPHI